MGGDEEQKEKQVTKEEIQMTDTRMKRRSPSHIIRELQMKTGRYHSTLLEWLKSKNMTIPKCW